MPGVPDTLVQEFVALFALFRPSQNEQIGGYSYCDDTCSSPGQPINPRTSMTAVPLADRLICFGSRYSRLVAAAVANRLSLPVASGS